MTVLIYTVTVASMVLGADVSDMPGFADPAVKKALHLLASDPPIDKVQQAALDYFGVAQGDLSNYRTASRLKALLPSINGSFSQDDTKTNRTEAQDPAVLNIQDNSATNGRLYSAGATWDLGALIFDSSQLETYALVGIHEDLVKEVTRLYYTRQHNMLALALDPPKDARAKAALIIRTREVESMLDAYTGGGWSRLKDK